MFGIPKRIKAYTGRFSLVDGIPFKLPVAATRSPALMAVFPINADKAKDFLPQGIHPLRLWRSALLVVTVIDYRETPIGKYVEYSIAIACTHGAKPAPRLLPALFMNFFKTGQYVVDLPVSSEISVKGGKGIWGMPKHQGNLNFNISADKVSSQYDLNGKLVTYVEIDKPARAWLPLKTRASNYCSFRGMLMKSDILLNAKAGIGLFGGARARFVIGDHPRLQALKALEIGDALATAFLPSITGILDDHIESWFLDSEQLPKVAPEGFESVIDLGLSEAWLAPPSAPIPQQDEDEQTQLKRGVA
ncbi:acetoacetate decarboxylase family protein [Shewanella salipaludis]|uniref:Acetoacetate decarboxylase family protein n=1 Tax=Shewanella salipaludis TaxID=2723052 RepID=A0A972FSQ3_9GAMM|nr:acetoacetate decarboxylase family protein [Shewanella salipaludis]NMH65021.1 acetoacetate decarboxylase family protein [Shewanella salipaludis]